LAAASELVRAYVLQDQPARVAGPRPGPGADLAGAQLGGADLRGADLRGSLLVGADLRGADLGGADVIGADLRGADLAGADLRDALYLTPSQVAAGRGDATTRLSSWVPRPRSWPG
ncbi:MAG TPA: pentapeptide repeat-containing protein, partial [Actinomycetes bacterium]|nr:pentapeptide repeat-containing protein [Actinomycetes bacterium]